MAHQVVTGYLSAVSNSYGSGLATVVIRTAKRSRKHTRRVQCYCDAGYGVRQLVAAFGDGRGGFNQASGEIKARFEIDALGLLASVEVL